MLFVLHRILKLLPASPTNNEGAYSRLLHDEAPRLYRFGRQGIVRVIRCNCRSLPLTSQVPCLSSANERILSSSMAIRYRGYLLYTKVSKKCRILLANPEIGFNYTIKEFLVDSTTINNTTGMA